MAATAAMTLVSVGSAVYQNQVRQKQKGLAPKPSDIQDPTLNAPDTTGEVFSAFAQASQAAAAARKRSLGVQPQSIISGPMGDPSTTPTNRKVLLGV